MAITGGCLCGAVRYSIAASKPLVTRQCWCRLCQYLGGGSSTVNAGFQSADFTVTGELARHEAVADSGNPRVRSFCRSEEHTSELQSLMRISYAVFSMNKKKETEYQTTCMCDIDKLSSHTTHKQAIGKH